MCWSWDILLYCDCLCISHSQSGSLIHIYNPNAFFPAQKKSVKWLRDLWECRSQLLFTLLSFWLQPASCTEPFVLPSTTFKLTDCELDIVMRHTCNLRTWVTEPDVWFPGQSGIHQETQYQKGEGRLERWLRWLLFLRSWVQFPATTWWLTTILQ